MVCPIARKRACSLLLGGVLFANKWFVFRLVVSNPIKRNAFKHSMLSSLQLPVIPIGQAGGQHRPIRAWYRRVSQDALQYITCSAACKRTIAFFAENLLLAARFARSLKRKLFYGSAFPSCDGGGTPNKNGPLKIQRAVFVDSEFFA